MSATAEQCVQRLNEVTGLDLALDDDGAAVFTYQERQVLLRFPAEEGVCLAHVQLTALEKAALPDALSDLLEANFLFSDTQGGALSWSRETRMAAMNFLLPLGDTDVEGFIHRLNRALAAADEWREKISEMNTSAVDRAAGHLAALRAGTAVTDDDNGHLNGMRSNMMPI